MGREYYDVLVAGISNCEFVPGLLVFHYRELAKEHLVGAQASVFPGVEVHENLFADSKLGVPVDNAETVSHLAT